MKKVKFNIIISVIITLLVFNSCNDKDEYPEIPEIQYEGFVKLYNPSSGLYDRGVLIVSFTDGDGDIGLRQDETDPPYDYNYFIQYYELQNGDTVRVYLTQYNDSTLQYDTLNLNARIPILTPQGSNKSIKGEIEDTLWMYNYQSNFDTIMFDAYLMDRALNKSNLIQTPLIIRN